MTRMQDEEIMYKEITKAVISLCKQVAEKEGKDVVIGLYVWQEFYKSVRLIYGLDREENTIYTVTPKTGNFDKLYWNNLEGGWLTPFWTISDCLKFFEKIGLNHEFKFKHFKLGGWRFTAEDNKYRKIGGEGETRLAACLKAVLAVVGEGK